jgi:hypothetical protein
VSNKSLQLQERYAHVERLVVTGDLLPQPVDLLLHADIPDREDKLLDSHLLINQMIGIRVEGLFAFLQRGLEVLAREWHRLAILLHELTQLCKACMECGELLY